MGKQTCIKDIEKKSTHNMLISMTRKKVLTFIHRDNDSKAQHHPKRAGILHNQGRENYISKNT